jgi:large subunit ribosomal protein L10e
VVEERGQIRMQALEAARQMASKYLTKYVGDANYYMRLDSVPHHVLRENRMLAMAGADRLQEGMRLAFGSPAGRAAGGVCTRRADDPNPEVRHGDHQRGG